MRHSTELALALLAVLALAWELYTLLNNVEGDTISATLRRLGRGQTFIPFMFGMLERHLWGGDETTKAAYLAGFDAGAWWPLLDGEPKKRI